MKSMVCARSPRHKWAMSETVRFCVMDIPGKACGPCSMCCQVLEIVELKKTAGILCKDCVAGGGCGIYAVRAPTSAAITNAFGRPTAA